MYIMPLLRVSYLREQILDDGGAVSLVLLDDRQLVREGHRGRAVGGGGAAAPARRSKSIKIFRSSRGY